VPTGRILEDERAFGDIDFGWGAWVDRPAAGHFDFTCRQVSLSANGVQILREGRFVEPTLAADVPGDGRAGALAVHEAGSARWKVICPCRSRPCTARNGSAR
jgi:hypothetical protein